MAQTNSEQADWHQSGPHLKWSSGLNKCSALFFFGIFALLIVAVTPQWILEPETRTSTTIGIVSAAVVLTVLAIGGSKISTEVFDEGVQVSWRFGWPKRRIAWNEIMSIGVGEYSCWHYGGFGCRFGKWDPAAADVSTCNNWAWSLIGTKPSVIVMLKGQRKFTWTTDDAQAIVEVIKQRLEVQSGAGTEEV